MQPEQALMLVHLAIDKGYAEKEMTEMELKMSRVGKASRRSGNVPSLKLCNKSREGFFCIYSKL